MRNILIALLLCSLFAGDAQVFAQKQQKSTGIMQTATALFKKQPPKEPYPEHLKVEMFGCVISTYADRNKPPVMWVQVRVWVSEVKDPKESDKQWMPLWAQREVEIEKTNKSLKALNKAIEKAQKKATADCNDWTSQVRERLTQKLATENGGKRP